MRSFVLLLFVFFDFRVPLAFTFAMIWSMPSKCSELLLFSGFLSNSCCEWWLFFRPCLMFFVFEMPLDIDLLFSMLPVIVVEGQWGGQKVKLINIFQTTLKHKFYDARQTKPSVAYGWIKERKKYTASRRRRRVKNLEHEPIAKLFDIFHHQVRMAKLNFQHWSDEKLLTVEEK